MLKRETSTPFSVRIENANGCRWMEMCGNNRLMYSNHLVKWCLTQNLEKIQEIQSSNDWSRSQSCVYSYQIRVPSIFQKLDIITSDIVIVCPKHFEYSPIQSMLNPNKHTPDAQWFAWKTINLAEMKVQRTFPVSSEWMCSFSAIGKSAAKFHSHPSDLLMQIDLCIRILSHTNIPTKCVQHSIFSQLHKYENATVNIAIHPTQLHISSQ